MENARRTLSEVITAIQPREEYSLYRDFQPEYNYHLSLQLFIIPRAKRE